MNTITARTRSLFMLPDHMRDPMADLLPVPARFVRVHMHLLHFDRVKTTVEQIFMAAALKPPSPYRRMLADVLWDLLEHGSFDKGGKYIPLATREEASVMMNDYLPSILTDDVKSFSVLQTPQPRFKDDSVSFTVRGRIHQDDPERVYHTLFHICKKTHPTPVPEAPVKAPKQNTLWQAVSDWIGLS